MAGRFIPDDYVNVDERIRRYYDEGGTRIVTEAVHLTERTATFKATVYRDDQVWATGHAHGAIDKDKGLEKTETVSIGRALANAGFVRQGEQRASREEMEQFHEAPEKPKEQPERIRLKRAAMEAAGGDVDEATRLFGMVMEKHLYTVDDDVNPESVDAMLEWLENVNEVS